MSSRTDIDALSITDGKISNQAAINPAKIKPADEASFLIAQSNEKYHPKIIHGDGTIDASGKLTINPTSVVEEDVLPVNHVKIGPSEANPASGNQTINVGEGEHSIPRRDSSGNLKAETADQATNAEKLDNQEGTYYTDTSNHTSSVVSSTTNAGQGLTYTTQTKPLKELVADFDYTAEGSGFGGSSLPVITHNFGYIPSCEIYKVDGSNLEEIDMNVVSTTTTTTISFNYINHNLKIVLR